MSAAAATHWFWSDWLGDQAVRRLTPAERGVWIDLLALAAAAAPTGYVCDEKGRALTNGEIARVVGVTPEEASELIAGILEKGVASRDRTGRIYNRRMVRDAALKSKRAKSGRRGGQVTANKHFGKLHLPQQVLQHGTRTPYLKKEIYTLTEVPRARSNGVTEPQHAARAPPEIPPPNAATHNEGNGLGDGPTVPKRPHEMTVAEIAEKLAARREADEALAADKRKRLNGNGHAAAP